MEKKMKCPECGKEMRKINAPYHYKDSGLSNVYLIGIPMYECSCGVVVPRIPRMADLLNVIADGIVEKKSALTGEELRYLRKKLGYKAQDFSALLGITPTTLSRWENEHEKIGPSNDRLVRLLYVILQNRPNTTKLINEFAELREKTRKTDRLNVKLKDEHYEASYVG